VAIVVVVYRGAAGDGEAIVGDSESSEVHWFADPDIPWDELAFETTASALRDWAAGRSSGL
jgi:hypothetical protein